MMGVDWNRDGSLRPIPQDRIRRSAPDSYSLDSILFNLKNRDQIMMRHPIGNSGPPRRPIAISSIVSDGRKRLECAVAQEIRLCVMMHTELDYRKSE